MSPRHLNTAIVFNLDEKEKHTWLWALLQYPYSATRGHIMFTTGINGSVATLVPGL